MDQKGIAILHEIAGLDWSSIEPAIFGTLFTRSLRPRARAPGLGAQYAGEDDILLVVESVLMEPLRRVGGGAGSGTRAGTQAGRGRRTRAVATEAQTITA